MTDIFGLKQSPLSTTAYAWVYTTTNGNIFIQYDPQVGGSAAANWLAGALSSAPYVGGALQATIISIVNTAANPKQITSQEWSGIQQSIDDNIASGGKGPTLHECFTGPLALG